MRVSFSRVHPEDGTTQSGETYAAVDRVWVATVRRVKGVPRDLWGAYVVIGRGAGGYVTLREARAAITAAFNPPRPQRHDDPPHVAVASGAGRR